VDVLLSIIIVLGGVLLFATVYMEWIGLVNVITPRSGPRYDDCGHLRVNPVSSRSRCWRCRHRTIDHLLHPMHH